MCTPFRHFDRVPRPRDEVEKSHTVEGVRSLGYARDDELVIAHIAKGLESKTNLTMHELIQSELPPALRRKVVTISGPSIAKEMVRYFKYYINMPFSDLINANCKTARAKTIFFLERKNEPWKFIETRLALEGFAVENHALTKNWKGMTATKEAVPGLIRGQIGLGFRAL